MALGRDVTDRKSNDVSRNSAVGFNKMVIRGLPPVLDSETFLKHVSPLPAFSYYYFISGEHSDGPYSRAYFCFTGLDDAIMFQERFDGYVFLDEKGNEFPAMVESAPCHKVPKAKVKIDPKTGTIENDPDYLKFLESLEKNDQESVTSPETILEDIEAKDKVSKHNQSCHKMTTPLIDFLKKKKEDRKEAQLMKAKQKEDEKRKRQALKEQNKIKIRERCLGDQEQNVQKDQDKMKILTKSIKSATPKGQAFEDLKAKEKSHDYYHKGKSVYEKRRVPEMYKKGKGKYGAQKEKREEDGDAKQSQRPGDAESKSQRVANLDSSSDFSKDVRHEPPNNVEAARKSRSGGEYHERQDQRYRREESHGSSDNKVNENKGRVKNKERPERAIYRPGQRKEKASNESNL